jgi:hypothetical protein
VTLDLKAFYIPKDNYMNRQRAVRGTLVNPMGTAQMKTAYLLDLDDTQYPEIADGSELGPHRELVWKAVWDVATNSRAPAWDQDRLRYSKMLCAVVDIRVSPGGVSS